MGKELAERKEGFEVKQINFVVDVLGGYDNVATDDVKRLLGKSKADKVLSSFPAKDSPATCHKNYERHTLVLTSTGFCFLIQFYSL